MIDRRSAVAQRSVVTGRRSVAAGLGLGLALALAGCNSSGHHAAASTSGVTTTTTAGGAASTTSPGIGPGAGSAATMVTAPATTTATAPAGPSRCATSALSASLSGANGTAGSVYYSLVFTNTGSVPCILQGYPGVSFVNGNISGGPQVGAAADRMSGSAPAVTLAPGQSSTAQLKIGDSGNYGSGCDQTATDGLRIYPPDQTASLFVAHTDMACANTADVTLQVGAFQN